MSSVALVILAKHPTPGRVKTRLQPAYTPRQSADIQDILLRHAVRRFSESGIGQVIVCFDPPSAEDDFAELLRHADVERLPQCGGDLGCRISHVAATVESRFERVLMFGVDSPDVPIAYVVDLAEKLGTHDVVLAPTDDGGFWSIGVRGGIDLSEPLNAIGWSSGHEMVQVMQKLQAVGLTVGTGESWCDVDHPPDVVALLDRLNRSSDAGDRALLESLSAVLAREGAVL